jgi:hypothetical protein
MRQFEEEKHKDFIRKYKIFQEQFNKLHWKKNPDWFLEFKKHDDETFKPIEEYQGFYFISNYGRVVSFKRKLPGERRSTKIKGFLAVALNNFGSTNFHYIHELVYSHFVDKIKTLHRVVHKDSDITNNYYKNLEEVKITKLLSKDVTVKPGVTPSKKIKKSEITKKASKEMRAAKHFKREKEEKINKTGDEFDIGVLQFTREGKFVRKFLSIREAARDLKIKPELILDCLKGESHIAAGSQWRYLADPNFDEGIFDISPVSYSRKQFKKPIYQYDIEGNFIQEFASVNDAARTLGISPSAISFAAKKATRTAAGYRWKPKEK